MGLFINFINFIVKNLRWKLAKIKTVILNLGFETVILNLSFKTK